MIRRDQGKITLTCEACGQSETDTKFTPYPQRWKEAQAKGWTAERADGSKDWTHRCPECKV